MTEYAKVEVLEIKDLLETRVSKTLNKCKRLLRYDIQGLDKCISSLGVVLESLNELHFNEITISAMKEVVDDTVERAIFLIKDHFLSKAYDGYDGYDGYEGFEKESDSDLDPEYEGFEAIIPEGFLDKNRLASVIKKIKEAQDIKEAERKNRKYKKVKRVPPKKNFDASDVAAALGMKDLAKQLTIDYPKPFVNVYKEDGVTRRQYNATSSDDVYKVDFDKLNNLLSSPVKSEEQNKKTSFKKDSIEKSKDVSLFSDNLSVVNRLEVLIGKLTTEKLVVERKLTLVTKALNEATSTLDNANINEILKFDESFNNNDN